LKAKRLIPLNEGGYFRQIIAVIYRSVNQLIDAYFFCVGICDEKEGLIHQAGSFFRGALKTCSPTIPIHKKTDSRNRRCHIPVYVRDWVEIMNATRRPTEIREDTTE
jgi:hypothetical protein